MQDSISERNIISSKDAIDTYNGKFGNFAMNHSSNVFLGSKKYQWKNFFIWLVVFTSLFGMRI
jgi:hypothetical protein